MTATRVVLGATVLALVAATLLGIQYSRGRIGTVEDLVTARNAAGTAPLTASLIASTLGTWILFSPPEAAVGFGGITGVLGYGIGLGAPLAIFAVVGVRIRRLVPHGHAVTEYVLARYGRAMYALVLAVSALYMFVFLAAELTGIAAALALVAGVSPPLTAGLVGLFVFAYTGYGGLVASIVTDTVQALVMLPLLAVGFAIALWSLGGAEAIHARIVASDPALLTLANPRGVRFAFQVGLALLGATILNQGLWQRVYAAEDRGTLRRSFAVAAVAVMPVVFLSGLFGLDAAVLGLPPHRSHASFFAVVLATEPGWMVLAIVILAVLLVMSSADTLLSGLASLAVQDLSRLLKRVDGDEDESVLLIRLLTGVLALAATVVGALQPNELRLFLTADLLSAATFVPVVAGLYTGEVPEWGAVAASLGGVGVGAVFYPALRWVWLGLLPAPVAAALPEPSLFVAFTAAVGLSLTVTAASAIVSDETTDLNRLEQFVRQTREDVDDGVTR